MQAPETLKTAKLWARVSEEFARFPLFARTPVLLAHSSITGWIWLLLSTQRSKNHAVRTTSLHPSATCRWQFETVANDRANGLGIWLHTCNAAWMRFAHSFNISCNASPRRSRNAGVVERLLQAMVDVVGGGSAIVTAGKIKTMNTREWLHREVTRILRSKLPPILLRQLKDLLRAGKTKDETMRGRAKECEAELRTR